MLSQYPDLLNVYEVSKLLHISRQRVYHLIEAGLLQAVRPGKAYLIPKTCLIDYINREVSHM
ncbi:MAG: helix-turn-helix domain-containing protein [Christensenellaceae bacterium]